MSSREIKQCQYHGEQLFTENNSCPCCECERLAERDDIIKNAIITDKVYTIVIWSNFQYLPKLFVLPTDIRHLNGVVIGSCNEDGSCDDEVKQAELSNIIYFEDTGEYKHKEYANLQECLQFIGDKPFGCINCGMYP